MNTRRIGESINDTNLSYIMLMGTKYSAKERTKLDKIKENYLQLIKSGMSLNEALNNAMAQKRTAGIK